MKNNKKKLIIQLIVLTISIITIIGSVSYAYFKAQVGSGAKTNVNVQAGTVDNLTFDKCSPISLAMTQQNFGENSGNQEGSTCVKAKLEANNTTNTATENYNVYLDIKENNFVYTTQEQKPEIILQVTDPSGNNVTSITGLTYNTELQGFDITTKKGLVTIANNYEIKVNNASANPKTEEWQIKVIVINLDSDQTANAGKILKVEGIVQKGEIENQIIYNNCPSRLVTIKYHEECDSDLLACRVAKDFDISNIADSKVILHNGIIIEDNGACDVLDAEDNSYRYTGGDYKITKKAEDAGFSFVNTHEGNLVDGIIGVNVNNSDNYVGITASSATTPRFYYLNYDINKVQYATYFEALNIAISDGYIVSRELDNYVCFGYDKTNSQNELVCPEENLYRIIGAFDDDGDNIYNVKLIKNDYATSAIIGNNNFIDYLDILLTAYKGTNDKNERYIWSDNPTTNNWYMSSIRTNNLNDFYINNYLKMNDSSWLNMLVEKDYYIGTSDHYNAKTVYNNERIGDKIRDKVSLMYASDFGYAINQSFWNKRISAIAYSNSVSTNWLHMGIYEMTMTATQDQRYVLSSNHSGRVLGYPYRASAAAKCLRPVFYLNENVIVKSGDGTKNNPYRLN